MSQCHNTQCHNTHRHNVTVYSVTPSQNTSVYSVTVESRLHCKLPCLDSIYGPVRIGGQIPTLSIQIILIVIFYRKSATLNPNFDQLQFKWLEMACQGFIGPSTSDKWLSEHWAVNTKRGQTVQFDIDWLMMKASSWTLYTFWWKGQIIVNSVIIMCQILTEVNG